MKNTISTNRFHASILSLFVITAFLFNSCSKEQSKIEMENIEETENEEETQSEEAEVCKIVEKDGLLILEAESFDLKGKWRVVEDEKASGGKYIEYYGSNSYNSQNLTHEISIKFTINGASKYLVKWYMRQPDEAEGDKSNDVWIYFPNNYGRAWVNDQSVVLEQYEKFVSRGKGDFAYGGVLDLHNPKASSWYNVEFPAAGEYSLKICARSEFFQLDKIVLSKGMTNEVAMEKSKSRTETISCE
ncbi:hypothetical protein [Flavicella sediminum]|uniref:hypothetical protein n=1 Tax=Flavicella sediminum TaxID=2585141 RepID=UPI0011247402|nr:hypothetical protein [Flavicella sediminum]